MLCSLLDCLWSLLNFSGIYTNTCSISLSGAVAIRDAHTHAYSSNVDVVVVIDYNLINLGAKRILKKIWNCVVIFNVVRHPQFQFIMSPIIIVEISNVPQPFFRRIVNREAQDFFVGEVIGIIANESNLVIC